MQEKQNKQHDVGITSVVHNEKLAIGRRTL